ncbi:hypothetical protein MEQU1_003283 [Malassezia equina]|uniref:ferric-chelate reductase (NADPH) n=1 Tax=Malassezia equina TaxID=1381935 RepID=A0AAF0J515_9BASI|nr:hypothetical protein MEQU1_003283 [Malassezia equina]
MMSAGMYPFMFAMALKVNPISLLTGISHAHLQVYHQATCILSLIFAIIHTAVFVNAPLREGGMNALKEVWFGNFIRYWSGTVAIFFMLWLCLSSFGVFRKMSYEFFVVQHIISAALFLGFSFVHFKNLLDSHIWLWATLGVWLFSIVARSLSVLMSSNFFCGPRATVRVLTQVGKAENLDQERPAEFLRLSFITPLRWHAGQHVYVRFPGVYPWQAHPFTCMSIPSFSPHLPNKLVLLARVEKGITRQLYNMTAGNGREQLIKDVQVPKLEKASVMSPDTESDPSLTRYVDMAPSQHIFEDRPLPFDQDTREITAYLDGPYGHNYSLGMYEHAVLVAAGSGITFCLPQVAELLRRSVNGDPIITKSVCLIWTIRSFDMIRWIKEEMQQLDDLVHRSKVMVDMHVYASREMVPLEDEHMREFSHVHHGQRVNIGDTLEKQVAHAIEAQSKTMCISACAPKDLVANIGNKKLRVNTTPITAKLSRMPMLSIEKPSGMNIKDGLESPMEPIVDMAPTQHIFENGSVPFDQDTRELTAYLDGTYSHSYGPELQQLDELVHQSDVSVRMDVYASREMVAMSDEDLHDFLHAHHARRVDVVEALDAQVAQAIEAQSRTMCVLACAPKDLVCRVGNKVSSLNASIAMGRLKSLRDVRFIPELFSF